MAPVQQKTDILISIKTEQMANIASRAKTHEFRKYLLPATVTTMWFYTTSPVQMLEYVAVIDNGKTPGEIDPSDDGIGNKDFNAGLKESMYGYEILQLYRLKQPLSLKALVRRDYIKGPPQKYQWVKQEMLDDVALDEQEKVF
ncbi:hypothetical protein RUND412_005481 [Rhizina undulata]